MDTTTILKSLLAERNRIDQAIAAIQKLSSNSHGTLTGGGRRAAVKARTGRRRMSAASRRRLSELMKKRWASGKMGKRKAKAA